MSGVMAAMEVVWLPQHFLRPDFACVSIQLADDYALASQAEYAACTLKGAVRRATSFVCHTTNGFTFTRFS